MLQLLALTILFSRLPVSHADQVTLRVYASQGACTANLASYTRQAQAILGGPCIDNDVAWSDRSMRMHSTETNTSACGFVTVVTIWNGDGCVANPIGTFQVATGACVDVEAEGYYATCLADADRTTMAAETTVEPAATEAPVSCAEEASPLPLCILGVLVGVFVFL